MIRTILSLFSERKVQPAVKTAALETEQKDVGLSKKGFWDSILEANSVYIDSVMASMNIDTHKGVSYELCITAKESRGSDKCMSSLLGFLR